MQKWEYRIQHNMDGGDLLTLGKAGWELVSVVGIGDYPTAYFKRPIADEIAENPSCEIKFNLNDFVRVKLSDYGRKIHRATCEPNHTTAGISYAPPIVDGEGYSTFQMHELMDVFGKYLSLGAAFQPFESMDIFLQSQPRIHGTDVKIGPLGMCSECVKQVPIETLTFYELSCHRADLPEPESIKYQLCARCAILRHEIINYV